MDMTWLEEHLFHHALNNDEREVLNDCVEVRGYQKGEVLIVEQAVVNGLFVLKDGVVALKHEQHGQSVQIGRLESGAQLGDMSLFGASRASVTVVALCDCTVYQLPQKVLNDLMCHRQSLMQNILQNSIHNLSQALRQMNDQQAYTWQYMQGVHAA